MEKRSATILYIEPKRVADWKDEMRFSPQMYSGRVWSIRLLYVIFKSNEPHPDETAVRIIKETIRDYPELADEVKERFPGIFD